ncbi:MAG TPA: heavy metal-responsive transcriptional regulator [Burkholderiales bacterium]|nr:heavy metal-responsive transcriptional regulator [Burkholderiales bacterium]
MAREKKAEALLTIGALARACGTTPDTIRYYERERLLPRPQRAPSRFRLYEPPAVVRLRFIREAKALGFSLEEIRELLALRVDRTKTCGDVRARARVKIAEIEARIDHLARVKAALDRLAAGCAGSGPTSECPILDALEAGNAAQAANPAESSR